MAGGKAPRAQLPWDQSLPAFTPLPQSPQPAELAGSPIPLSPWSWAGKDTLCRLWCGSMLMFDTAGLGFAFLLKEQKEAAQKEAAVPMISHTARKGTPTPGGCSHLALLAGKPAQ